MIFQWNVSLMKMSGNAGSDITIEDPQVPIIGSHHLDIDRQVPIVDSHSQDIDHQVPMMESNYQDLHLSHLVEVL